MLTTPQVRTVEKDGEPWFVAGEICGVLELGNPRQVVSRLDEDEKDGVHIADAIGRMQQTTTINESGLYSLVLTSRKPEAKRFKKWVTSVVLPSIHKTGSYALQPEEPQSPQMIMARASPHQLPSRDDCDGQDMLPIMEAEAKERQKQGGKDHGRGMEKVNQKVGEPIVKAKQVDELAAEIVGTNKEYVSRIRHIAKVAPEMMEEMREGKLSVRQARRAIDAAQGKGKEPQRTPAKPQGVAQECTQALQFSTIAISQLKRIRHDDPRRFEALNEVIDFITKLKGEWK